MSMIDYLYKTKPFAHQKEIFELSKDKEAYGLLLEMGCGKSKIIVDTSCWLYAYGKIDAALIIAPNGVTNVWPGQYIDHAPDYIDYSCALYRSSPNKKEEELLCKTMNHKGLKVVVMNIEAFATKKGALFAKNFLTSLRSIMIIDESSMIKSPKAIRTKSLLKLSVHAKYRRILTGTPITQGPLDLFTQFSFLDSQILRCQSYFAFRNKYAIMKEMRTAGRSFQVVESYCNIKELQNLIAPHSYRVTKNDCLDLPEKLYSKRYVELSALQRKLYTQLKKDIVAELNGMVMSAPLALTKLLRLQQIVGGFFVPDQDLPINSEDCFDFDYTPSLKQAIPQPIDKVNPRIESLIELLEETNGKAIIWARFRSEISEICRAITTTFGQRSAVEYHGGVDNETRSDNIRRFQNDDACRFFVGHVQAGGKGITLTAANTVVYYSNDFSLENRLQSEDRCHRIGQKNNVTYIDIIASNTLDEKVVETLRGKKSMADLVTGDDISSWI
ncbi:MAG: DEAD/DEAH box helicase [Chlorobium sp.]|nr:DEAD/DEAH box helicase [Chlorobium sp.]